MPLEILGPLVVFGIAFVVLFVRFVANTPPRLINDETTANTILLRDFPEATPDNQVVISSDKTEALIGLKPESRQIGLVHVLGSKHVTRLLGASDIGNFSVAGDSVLILKLNELTLPEIKMRFMNDNDRDGAFNMLEKISSQKNIANS